MRNFASMQSDALSPFFEKHPALLSNGKKITS